MSFLKKILLGVNIILVVSLLLGYMSLSTDPNENGMYALFGVFYPVLLLANLGMMLLWMLIEYKYLFLSLVTILLGWSHLTSFVNISGPIEDTSDIRVMSYNIGQGYDIRSKDKKVQEKRTKLFINYLSGIPEPDVICIQESNKFVEGLLAKVFSKHTMHKIENKGAVIFTKYPLLDGGQVEFGTRTNSCLYADIKVGKKTVRVYNLHLQSNQISKQADSMIENGNLNEPETWTGIKGMLGKYLSASKRRSKQSNMVKSHADKSPYPTIICGDVNDPPTSHTYGTLSENMHDAFHIKGSGIGTTYGGSIPMLRIDYIFADREHMDVSSYVCRKEQYSDHYPIYSDITLK